MLTSGEPCMDGQGCGVPGGEINRARLQEHEKHSGSFHRSGDYATRRLGIVKRRSRHIGLDDERKRSIRPVIEPFAPLSLRNSWRCLTFVSRLSAMGGILRKPWFGPIVKVISSGLGEVFAWYRSVEIPGQADSAELPAGVRRKESAVASAGVAARRDTRGAAQDELVAHELSVVLPQGPGRRAVAGIA